MNLDWKHIAGALLGLALGFGIKLAADNGIEVKCPAQPSAVIQGGK